MNTFIKQTGNGRLGLLGILLLLFVLMPAPLFSLTNQVPMSGTFSGAGATFSGQVTYLGHFVGVIDNTTVPPHAVWTAANGDTLSNITTSFVIDFSAPVAPNVYPYRQTIAFTDGSSRFRNAIGSAEITGTIDVTTFAYNGRINGTISPPNSG